MKTVLRAILEFADRHLRGLPTSVLVGLLALTALRLILATVNEISPDEAYYTMWAERLDWSYYSKGPGIASALKVTTTLFGKTTFGVRLLAPLLALASSLVVFRLARALFDERVGTWSVVLLNITPIFNAGSVIMNIDPLSVFLWLSAMLTLWFALHRADPKNLFWPATGLLIGLGFLAKYTNALQLLSIVLLFALTKRWRANFTRPGLYLLLAAFAVCTIPVLIWNAQQDWITVTHLKERGSLDESTGIHPAEFFEYLGAHLGVYSPLVFIGLVASLVAATKAFFTDRSQGFVVAFSLPVVGLYFLLSWRQAGEVNWTAPGFAPAAMLLALHWHHVVLKGRRKAVLRNTAIWIAALLSAVMLNTDLVRRAGVPWPYAKDPTKRILGWQETAAAVGKQVRVARRDLDAPVFLIANRYQVAAVLNFYLDDEIIAPASPTDTTAGDADTANTAGQQFIIRPDKRYPPVHAIESASPENQFSFWPGYADTYRGGPSPFLGKNALYITDNTRRTSAPSRIRSTFREVVPTAVFQVVRRGQVLRTVKIFACYDYQGLPL